MRDLSGHLHDWREAGLVTEDQVSSILAYESARPGSAEPSPRRDRRPIAAEAIGYLGAALAVGALFMLLVDVWPNLLVGGKLALVGLLTMLLAGAGAALHGAGRPPLQRLTSVLFTGAVIGVGWLAALVTYQLLVWGDLDAALAAGLTVLAAALPLYLWRRRALPQLTLLVAVGIVAGALLARSELPIGPPWGGLVFWAIGVAWLLLGLGNWLEPARLAGVAGAVVALVAVQAAAFDDEGVTLLVIGLLTAGALVGLAVMTEATHHLVVGAVGLFVLVPQLSFELFGDAIGAPATLLVVGLLLVLLAIGIGRVRREVRPVAPSAADEGGGTR